MGRGRAKAKQQKVARQLKYQTGGTSIEALREELGADPSPAAPADNEFYDAYDDEDGEDRYDELANGYHQRHDDNGRDEESLSADRRQR